MTHDALSLRFDESATDYDLMQRAPAMSAVHALRQAVRRRLERNPGLGSLTPAERLCAVLLLELDAEICNGGLHQYLSNDFGDGAEEVREALTQIGARDALAALEAGLTYFPGGAFPSARAEREAVLREALARAEATGMAERFWGVFDAIDQRYYAARAALLNRVLAFAQTHREALRDL